ncbi:polymorphic toxin-type HINT domain-containing protein [Amycolatopsis sp. SID8362]|uniref:polymorphic toxin-type HINT domain-containing protein n=1 Tax=Amycolatopsis sp. SID8362 TaxID=2690346 RepID=UPI00137069BF|nr:polymorphic toxin-type HINT domain-containing protein [Amycolatopsis sp. SID8362]NBH08277.1 hypothetical protein [Amycolatopsis sp. SID8362]NED44972.1 hypothetical protein [Amycolatopsis sp. SID8362]
MADGSSKPISSVRIGDRLANSQPGKAGMEAHPVDRVIVTQTDHDFVDLKVKPSRVRRAAGRVAAGLAVAAAVVTGSAATASAAPASLTTTYHHPFYDVTRGEFAEAVDLHVGDRLQTADGGEATVEEVTPYHSTEVTYDLTIDELHTYYVYTGDTPVLVHNCGGELPGHREVCECANGAKPAMIRGPKPAGTGPHNLKIAEVAEQVTDGEVIAGGGMLPEQGFSTPGGFKGSRRPDILVEREDGTQYGINVGKQSMRTGAPIKREAEAVSDLEGIGMEMHFVPYN